jgi:hypothetical protein
MPNKNVKIQLVTSFEDAFVEIGPKPFVIANRDLPAQPVDATQALNLSAGVSNCKVSRGRSLS